MSAYIHVGSHKRENTFLLIIDVANPLCNRDLEKKKKNRKRSII